MRVGIDATVLHGCFSGVENAVRGLLVGLGEVDRATEYVLFCGRGVPLPDPLPPNFRWHCLPFPAASRTRRILFQQVELPRLARRLGLQVLHGPAYVTPIARTVPTIASIYDLMVYLYPALCAASNRLHYRSVLSRSAPRCHRVVVPSHAVARSVEDVLGIVRERVVVAHLGIDARFVPPRRDIDPQAERKRLGLPDRYLLYVGNIEPKKGLDTLCRALAVARRDLGLSVPLVIAGKRAWGLAGLDTLIHELGLRDAVLFTGYVPAEELPLVYGLADAFVFPSVYEGFGLPPLEAMACGAPVIASDAGALPEVTGDAVLRVPSGDVRALADAMWRLCEDRDLRACLSARGTRQAARFSWRNHAELVHNVYAEVADGA